MPNYLSAGRTDVMDVLVVKGALTAQTGVTATSAIVKAAASQTADFQQWQDSAAAVIARMTATGNAAMVSLTTNQVRLRANMSNAPITGQEWHIQSSDADTRLALVRSGSHEVARFGAAAAHPVLALTAYASQTGDLQQWQDSTGVKRLWVTSVGGIWGSPTGSEITPAWYIGNNGDASFARIIRGGGLTTDPMIGSITLDGMTTSRVPNATWVPLTVQGAASQTADLQRWQDSAGVVLSKMTAAGDLDFITSTRGPILVSPDGLLRRRVGIDNTGALVLAAA